MDALSTTSNIAAIAQLGKPSVAAVFHGSSSIDVGSFSYGFIVFTKLSYSGGVLGVDNPGLTIPVYPSIGTFVVAIPYNLIANSGIYQGGLDAVSVSVAATAISFSTYSSMYCSGIVAVFV